MQFIERIGYKSTAKVRARRETIQAHPFHLHKDAIEILCVLDGAVDIWDCAATYTLGPGAVHVFNRNDAHRITAHGEGEDNLLLTIHIDCGYYSRFFDDMEKMYFICDTSDGRQSTASEMRYLRFLLSRIAQEYEGSCSPLLLEEYTRELIGFLSEQFRDYIFYVTNRKWAANIVWLRSTDQDRTPGGLLKDYNRLHRIADYVEENFRETVRLQDLAQTEQVSPSYLSRYIRQNLGMTFSRFVSLIRCEEASKLLSSTDHTVDQIAVSCGFSDRKELARHFARWYRHTPSQYRREIQKDLREGGGILSKPADPQRSKRILDRYLDEY